MRIALRNRLPVGILFEAPRFLAAASAVVLLLHISIRIAVHSGSPYRVLRFVEKDTPDTAGRPDKMLTILEPAPSRRACPPFCLCTMGRGKDVVIWIRWHLSTS